MLAVARDTLLPCSAHSSWKLEAGSWKLELKSRFPRRFRDCADPAVIQKPAPIQDDSFDALFNQPFGDGLPERLGSCHVTAASGPRERRLERGLRACRRRERLPRHVVDDLCVDMRHAAEHAQARPLRRARNTLALPERDTCAAILRGVDLHISVTSCQLPVASCQKVRLETGDWELETILRPSFQP